MDIHVNRDVVRKAKYAFYNFGIFLILMGSISSVFALAIQCPTGTQFIQTNDHIAQVIAKCGKPLHAVVLNPRRVKTLEVWQYSYRNFAFFRSYERGFSVIFAHGFVIQINANHNKNLAQATCLHGHIGIGDDRGSVREACGPPNFTKSVPPLEGREYIRVPRITKLIYKSRTYLPATSFVFKNGLLVGKL